MDNLRAIFEDLFANFNLMDEMIAIIVNLIIVFIWILLGIVLVKLSKGLTKRIIRSKKDNPRTVTISKLISNIMKYLIWFIIMMIILTELGINIAPFVASAGVLGLAIGFGAQEIVKDFISGFFIILEDVFNVGDVIECQGFKGEVLELGLRTTRVKNYKDEVIVVNNGDMKNVINYSKFDSLAIVDFGVGYDTDLTKINDIMDEFIKHISESMENLIDNPKYLGITELADSSINMKIIAKTKNGNHFQLERDIRKELVVFLTKKKIEIPFPQVVVHNA